MRIRSLIELNDFLDTQLSWRKRELTNLKFAVGDARTSHRGMMLRAAICLLYSHWEGFIKEAATGYVCFVALRGLKFREVAPNLVALGWRADIQKAGRSNLATLHTELTQKMMGEQEETFRPNWDAAIDVESNLNSKALQQVLCVVGINREEYMTKGPVIDERLVKNRNGIAHGQGVTIDEDDYDDLHDFVVQMLNLFRNDIENSAVLETYKRD